jgi:Integrase core domain
MTSPTSLMIPPFPVPHLFQANCPENPSSSSSELDPFTCQLWHRHEDTLRKGNPKQLYSSKMLVPDSYYINLVKELHQHGHLERCGLSHTDPIMYASIRNKLSRNLRFILFDVEPGPEMGTAMAGPVLYVVKRAAMALPLPSVRDCKRVIPIGQVRALLGRLHTTENHRVTGIEQKVREEYVGITRAAIRFYRQHCAVCVEHEPLDKGQLVVRPIRSLYARQRYVVDLIAMHPDVVQYDATYRYILTCVDHFSRYRLTRALQTKHASRVLQALVSWWQEYGKPDILQSDNGMEFCAGEVKELCRKWGVRKRHSRPNKPSTNGSVERANHDTQERIALHQSQFPHLGWVECLSFVTTAHNRCWSRVQKCKPNELFPMPPPEERLVLPDESMLPMGDWSDDETDTELNMEKVGCESEEDEGEDEELVESGSQHDGQDMEWDAEALVDQMKQLDPSSSKSSILGLKANGRSSVEADDTKQVRSVVRDSSPSQPTGVEKDGVASSKDRCSKTAPDLESVYEESHPLLPYGENIPDEISPSVLVLGMLPGGEVGGMRYKQWKRVSEQLYNVMRRCGVPGRGDCGIIALRSAHLSMFIQGKTMNEEEILEQRRTALEWLDINEHRYNNHPSSKDIVCDIDVLRSSVEASGEWVQLEYLWLYAMRYNINIYLVHVSACKILRTKETRSSFALRLITPERFDKNECPISNERPNTIAIYFHHYRIDRGNGVEKELGDDVGHFEYLVDREGQSCWRTDHEVVQRVLQPAMEEAYRIEYLNCYTENWEKAVNKSRSKRLPQINVGDLAALMISDYMRDKSDYNADVDGKGLRNMLVKVIGQSEQGKLPVHFEILTHKGVVNTWPLQQEFRAVGQDVDKHLKDKEVTEEMRAPKARVPLMSAWNFFLERRRVAFFDRLSEQALAASQPAPMGAGACSATTVMTRSRAEMAATIAPPQGHICCSCEITFRLAGSRTAAQCKGYCQQTMHSNASECKSSNSWVTIPTVGICCSRACAAVYQH